MESEPKPQPVRDVNATIMGILGEVMTMGANDSERSTLLNILANYEKKKSSAKTQEELDIVADEAIRSAEGVRDSKNAYH